MRRLNGKTWKTYICRLLICIMVMTSFGSVSASETANASEGISTENTGDTAATTPGENGDGHQPAADGEQTTAADVAGGQTAGENTTGGQNTPDDEDTDADDADVADDAGDADDADDDNVSVSNGELLDDPDVDYSTTISNADLNMLQEYRPSVSDPRVIKLASRTKRPKGKLTKKNGHSVYLCRNGKLLKSKWVKIGNSVYYFDNKGYAKTGSFKYKGYSYYSDSKGKLVWRFLRKVGKKLYYYGPTGAMVKSAWITIRGNRYYFLASGAMAKKRWIGNSYVNSNGQLSRGQGAKKVRTGTFRSKNKKQRLIIVGYSRAVHMSQAVTSDNNVIYIAQSGEHLSWVKKVAVPQLRKQLKKYPYSKVVFMCGYNDIAIGSASGAVKKFKQILTPLIKKYKKADFYVMDILPVRKLKGKVAKRSRSFNASLKAAYPKQSIGGYDYLVKNGFENSFDDVHYAPDTSRTIFNYILKKVK